MRVALTSVLQTLSTIIEYGGAARRNGDLFGTKSLLSMASKSFRRGLSVRRWAGEPDSRLTRHAAQGTSNVYTEHVPPLAELLDNAAKGKLKDANHPLSYGSAPSKDAKYARRADASAADARARAFIRLQEIIVYVVGGITYEEVVAVDRFVTTNAGVRVVLGGCNVHNSASFLAALTAARG